MGLCFFKFIVWLLVVYSGCEGKITGKAACESTGLGEPARVTCHYSQNVVKTGDVSAVSLLRDTSGKEEKVVDCHRFLQNGFDCIPKAGYKVNGTISDQMIINIPTVRPEHQGTYYCELRIQQIEFQMESCDLKNKEPNDAATSTPLSEKDSDDQLKGDTGNSNLSALIIAVIALILVLLVIAALVSAVVLTVRRRRRSRRNRWQPNIRVDMLEDEIVSLLPASYTGDGDGLCKKDVGQLSDNLTIKPEEVEDSFGVVSIGDNHDVSMAAKRPHSSGVHSAVEWKPSCTEDSLQNRDYSIRLFTDPSSSPRPPQFAEIKPCTDTDTVVRGHTSDDVGPRRFTCTTGDRQLNGDSENLMEKRISEGAVPSSPKDSKRFKPPPRYRKRSISDPGPSTPLSAADTDFSQVS